MAKSSILCVGFQDEVGGYILIKCWLSIDMVSPFTTYQRRLVVRIWVERGGDATIKTLVIASCESFLVRRVGVAVISFQLWYLDSAPPRKIRVRTVRRSTCRMHNIIIVLYDTAVMQRGRPYIGPSCVHASTCIYYW